MAQALIVQRSGLGWAARDVTGALYGESTEIAETIASAERLAHRIGATVQLSADAQQFSGSQLILGTETSLRSKKDISN